MPRLNVSLPGRAMSFPEWSEAIVVGVRRFLPADRAARKACRTVIMRRADREARLIDDGDAFCISFAATDGMTTMSSLFDSRPPQARHDFTTS